MDELTAYVNLYNTLCAIRQAHLDSSDRQTKLSIGNMLRARADYLTLCHNNMADKERRDADAAGDSGAGEGASP